MEADNTHQLPPGHFLGTVIEDRGCGIPPGNLASIFDPYLTAKLEGNGLGLASVYSIVKRHGVWLVVALIKLCGPLISDMEKNGLKGVVDAVSKIVTRIWEGSGK